MAKITFDNTWAKLEGTPQEIQKAREFLTYRVEGYQFMAAYKSHRWDGRRTLMTQDGRFPTGLASSVGAYLRRELVQDFTMYEDKREKPAPSIEWAPLKGITLQPHQERAVIRIGQESRGVVHHSVGAGKSIVIIEAVRRSGLPSLVIVPTKDLLYQLHEDFSKFISTPYKRIGMLGDGVWQPQDVTVATVQTVTRSLSAAKGRQGGIDLEGLEKRRRMVETLSRFQAVHIDECHHLPSDSYGVLMANLPLAYVRIGYSATPMRSGAREQELLVTGLCGPVIHQHDSSDNVKAGRSVRADVFMIETGGVPPDDGEEVYFVRGQRRVRRNYATAVDSGIVRNEERNRKIVKLAEQFGKRGPTIVLTERLEHGRLLASGLAERGHKEVQ